MQALTIISRSMWGAKPWAGQPHSVNFNERDYFLVHYHGGKPRNSVGFAVPREVEAIHRANGWSGVGYNFLVDQAGTIYEGRGWNLVGAHCPSRNRDGIGVYVAIGGDQTPSAAALRSVRALYDEACRRRGKDLVKGWHGRWYSTACPGPKLIDWVKGGMRVAPAVPATTRGQTVSLAAVQQAAKLDGPRAQGGTTSGAADDVLVVEQALAALGFLDKAYAGDGSYGTSTVDAYKAWQKQLGSDDEFCDGIPGVKDLTKLAAEFDFKVVS